MYKQIQKVIDWGVKLASIAITGPATWIVASRLFLAVESPALLFVMKFSALFLIEGVLFSNWILLEFDKNASPEIKARYGLTAMTMYIALAIIGWQNEGPTGLVFRVALLSALIGSGWDTYVYTWQRATSKVDRSVENSRRVKAHARRLAVKEARMTREALHDLNVMRLRAETESEAALIRAQRIAALEDKNLLGKRLIARIQLDDRTERLHLRHEESRLLGDGADLLTEAGEYIFSDTGGNENGSSNGKKKQDFQRQQVELSTSLPQVAPPIEQGIVEYSVRTTSSEDLQEILNILDALEDDPRASKRDISAKVGIEYNRVLKLMKEMLEDSIIYKEGRAHYPVEDAEKLARKRDREQARRR
jgi:hypothetical protein